MKAGLDSVADLDARYTSGQVTRKTTTTSRMVVRPKVKAKPLVNHHVFAFVMHEGRAIGLGDESFGKAFNELHGFEG